MIKSCIDKKIGFDRALRDQFELSVSVSYPRDVRTLLALA
jgi:hypothetical protein